MKNIIIGTAGHIDHGKTTLIKALTGRNTDRLKEEQDRGITIELGFTYFDLPSKRRAGIIDVPGHEKFVKNMLAGVSGMDIVLLVIAADEGIMPQTKEHLDILNILDVKLGLVVITKADTVDDEWLELVTEDIKENLKDTFLNKSPIIPVSSITKKGIDNLINKIDEITKQVEERDSTDIPRLPVDRVFTLSGFGTIVTGTLISGKLSVGDEVEVYPKTIKSRIRSIQVHGEASESAFAGQRVAVNLASVKKSDIDRGNIVAPIDSMKETMMIDVKLNLLKDSPRIIENRTRVRLFIGASEVMCRVILLNKENLTPGESCYAQLRLEETIIAKRADKFVIRYYSPITTIGGGIVLEPNPPKRKRFIENTIKELEIKENDDNTYVLENIIKQKSNEYNSLKDLSILTVTPLDKITLQVNELSNENKVKIIKLSNSIHIIHIDYYNEIVESILEYLKDFHNNHSLKTGVSKEEIRSKFFGSIKPKIGEQVLSLMINDKIIKKIEENISKYDFEIKYSSLEKEIKEYIINTYKENKFNQVKKEDIFNTSKYDYNDIIKVYDSMIDSNLIIKLNEDISEYNNNIDIGKEIVIKYINENSSISVSELRDILNTNRKYAIAFLEYLDKIKLTKRINDKRYIY